MRRAWWHQWFEGRVARDAEALQGLLIRICRQEAALACHLAERARALRFAPHRLSLEAVAERESQNALTLAREIGDGAPLAAAASPTRRPGTLTATKLIRDLEESEDLAALYRQARQLTSDGILREKLEALADGEAATSQAIRGILVTMDSYVMDLHEESRRGLASPCTSPSLAPGGARQVAEGGTHHGSQTTVWGGRGPGSHPGP